MYTGEAEGHYSNEDIKGKGKEVEVGGRKGRTLIVAFGGKEREIMEGWRAIKDATGNGDVMVESPASTPGDEKKNANGFMVGESTEGMATGSVHQESELSVAH